MFARNLLMLSNLRLCVNHSVLRSSYFSKISSKALCSFSKALKCCTSQRLIKFGNVFSPRLQSTHCGNGANQSEKNDVIVYVGPLKKKIKLVKILSLTSSCIALTLQPIVIYDLLQVNISLAIGAGLISTVFLSTPFIIHWIIKGYVTELTFNTKTKVFTAKTLNLFTQIKEMKFVASEVSVPTLPGILSSVLVRKTPLFVDANLIEDPDAYSHMMGYDKPIDLELEEDFKIKD